MRRFNKQRDEAVNPSEFRSYTRSKLYKNLRLNKLKQLLNKDKVLLRQDDVQPGGENSPRLADNPEMEEQPQGENQPLAEDQLQAEGTDTTSASPPPTLPTTQSPPPPTSTEPAAPVSPLTVAQTTRHPAPFDDRGGQGGPVLRNGKDYSPSPEQLDMAAARNPEITRIRLKVIIFFSQFPGNTACLSLRPARRSIWLVASLRSTGYFLVKVEINPKIVGKRDR